MSIECGTPLVPECVDFWLCLLACSLARYLFFGSGCQVTRCSVKIRYLRRKIDTLTKERNCPTPETCGKEEKIAHGSSVRLGEAAFSTSKVTQDTQTCSSFHHIITLPSKSVVHYIMLRVSTRTLAARCRVASSSASPITRHLSTSTLRSNLQKPIAFAFDIDGVLKAGPNVLPEAKRALQILEGKNPRNQKIPYIFITNGGGKHESARAKDLARELEVPVTQDQVIQAHTVMKSLVPLYADKPILMVGGPETPPNAAREVMQSYGFNNVYTTLDLHTSAPAAWPFSKVEAEQLPFVRVSFLFSESICSQQDFLLTMTKPLTLMTITNSVKTFPGFSSPPSSSSTIQEIGAEIHRSSSTSSGRIMASSVPSILPRGLCPKSRFPSTFPTETCVSYLNSP